jgi:Arc/MetJ-type ribon-helix-helix transcriptional regulator
MSNLTLNLDRKAEKSIDALREHYGATSKAEVIRKALALLQVAAEIDASKGELLARKNNKETKIIVR